MIRRVLSCGLLLAGFAAAEAHDPYEVTTVVYLQSNRIDLYLEMEFPTAMTLAGLKPSRPDAVSNQFESALPQLQQLAGGFFEFTAGNHVVLPLRTNVELGVENHVQCRVEFATTEYRPLRFVPRGLRTATDAPYGVALTVLDMVNKKVLGQTALFADTPPAEFPASAMGDEPAPGTPATVLTANPGVVVTAVARTDAEKLPRSSSRLLALGLFVFVAILLLATRGFRTRA